MKRFKHNFKKGMAFVLSLAMVAGLVPAMSGGANKVQAASGSGTEPSVSAYATKTQLMDGTFAPNANGTATNIGKLVFGKNSSGDAQKWYILGKDEGVSGDNTIIFAASPIATGQVFNSSTSNKTYNYGAGTGYGDSEGSEEVYANHYGASDLRVALKSMATDISYFTTAEQGLMNATTVTTKDTNNGVTYTTTDKLYALQGNYNDDKKLWAGTSDSTVLAMSSYWSNGSWFWLRSPRGSSSSSALLAIPGSYVSYDIVINALAVQPASNLNLSSVLFASASTAALSDTVESGTIASGTAMTLRLNGTGKNIGLVTYNTTTGVIKAAKGSTSQTVALVVQGKGTVNGEEKDWYYSKQITGTDTVNVSDIEAETYTPTSIDLSACKIWLEITDTDGLIYAVNADKEIEPINTTYVTKEQLMSSFKPNSDGTAVNIGKLVFGKNSSGASQEWYILGKDAGVSGDNTIIFAASPIAKNQVFENDYSNNRAFQPSFGVYASNPLEVYPNHYGASELRVVLQNMATDTSYFTSAEQGLMNDTTVTTKDTKNSATYTTTDKLYTLAADGSGSYYKTIKAGTSDSTVLAMSSYWSSGAWFWLRSPYDDNSNYALRAYPGVCVSYDLVGLGIAVQPASNLNLSSVLFASAATAASSDTVSGTLTDGTAMTLRLNGTGKNIGTVTYNATTGDIKVVRGDTSQPVSLVVQGNDGTNDWYYSKQITGTETVNASDIKSALSLTSGIDLSACKIWLEITDSTENLTYAVNATETVDSDISSVAITGIDTPTANTTLDTSAACATTGVSSTTPQITWTPSDTDTTAGYNTSYTASITLTADTGYKFVDSTTATINGNTATSVNKNTDGTLTVTYAFPATAKDKLISITAPQAITVANGTAYSAMNLPATVNIVTEGNTVSSASVTWDTTTPENGSYDPAVLTQQTVTLNGTVACPDSIDANGVSLTTTITITISAADIVGAPTANPTAGTYSENQLVALTSSTEGATIYYTTDGSEPTITGGVPGGTTAEYTAPIAVTGTEGQSITTTIKAIAVKNGMQDSSVETFTYTIQIPVAKYTVTVTNGSGTGQYAQGETVTITAGAAPSGQQFKEWEVVSGTITLASSTSETTTFTMPAEAVSVKANYEAIPVTGYTITATAGANGSISPSGNVTVTEGGSQTFTISASSGYEIDTLKVDNAAVTVSESYTFSDVRANHTIEVTFKQTIQNPVAPGIITQPGNATVKEGETATFSVAASGENLTYQWMINRNDGNGWVNIGNAKEASYTTSVVDKSCGGFQYKCVVSNSGGTVESGVAILNVQLEEPTYKMLEGMNGKWAQNSKGTLSFRADGDFNKFVGVKVDNSLLETQNYSAKSGSTIVTLKGDYLKTLSVGSHRLTVVYDDGECVTSFVIQKASNNNSGSPSQGGGNDVSTGNQTQSNGNDASTSNQTQSNSNDASTSNQTLGNSDNVSTEKNVSASGKGKKDDVPKTGDSTPIVWLFVLAGLSGAGVLLTGKKGNKSFK